MLSEREMQGGVAEVQGGTEERGGEKGVARRSLTEVRYKMLGRKERGKEEG